MLECPCRIQLGPLAARGFQGQDSVVADMGANNGSTKHDVGNGAPSRLDNHAVGVKMDLGFERNMCEKAFNMALEERATFGLEAGDDVGVESSNVGVRPVCEFGIVPAEAGEMLEMLGGFEGCIGC